MDKDTWLVGIDVGGTSVKMAFISASGALIHKWEIATDRSNGGKNITKDIADSLTAQLQLLGADHNRVAGVGIGAPGFIDMDRGFIHEAVNIGWKNYPLKEEMEKATGWPVFVDNDANIAAIGEMWKGAGDGADDVLCVTLGTGVGGGVIAGGNIVHGAGGMAGEIGHITVIPEGGFQCNCGRSGCLETVASATGIRRLALADIDHYPHSKLTEIYKETGDLTAKHVLDAARDLDSYAILVVEKVSHYLGLTLAGLAITLNPKKIVIGGGVSKAGDTLLKPLDHYLKQYTLPIVYKDLTLVTAILGNDAGIYGGAWLAKTHFAH
ncbi:ROK family glucokinase [Camelliibacillus cellulosilyticus]|uniref:Glucokinase n=1 Tax=Camelliibacillus cellulosilyticus TaxID=2174486 RepID=A0ABV9GIP1_9BACL